jgi:hypothetical protein
VLSNPSRYLGVAVPTLADLEKCKTLLAGAGPDLGRPVVISAYSTSEALVDDGMFIIGPLDDSLWNKQAAAKRASDLSKLIETASASREDAKKTANETLLAKNELSLYASRFGDGKLEHLRTKVKDAQEQLASVVQLISETQHEAAQAAEHARLSRSEATRLQKTEMSRVTSALQTLTAYRDDWEVKCAEWERQLTEAKATVKEQEAAETEAQAAIAKARASSEDALGQAKTRDEAATKSDQIRNGLALADERYDVAAALRDNPRTLPEIAAEYETTVTALRAAESEKTEPLAVEQRLKTEQLQRKRNEYGTKYPADRFPPAEVRSLIGNDYRELERIGEERVQDAQKQDFAARAAVVSASTTVDLHRSRRKHHNHTVPEATSYADETLASQITGRIDACQAATRFAQAAKEAAVTARSNAKDLKESIKLLDGQRASLNGLSLDFSTALADMSKFSDVGAVANEVSQLIKAHSESKKSVDTAEKRAGQAYETINKIAADEAFIKTDYEIALMLKENPLENTAADASRIEVAIQNRIDALNHDLSRMAEDFARATEALIGLVADASRILRRAVEHLKLPDNVPIVGNKSVFKMRTAVLAMSQEQKKQILSAYMEELTADRNIPETGAQLAAQALMRLADNKLGLKLLKMVDIEDEQYVAVDRLSHSGAEKISMALFLYFVTMRLRYEQRATVQRAESGVLVLDNPFAKATLRPIWVAIHSLAEAMGLQLIIATGMNELETLSVFKRHLRLGKTQVDTATGRIHVKVTDYQFFPTPDKAAA